MRDGTHIFDGIPSIEANDRDENEMHVGELLLTALLSYLATNIDDFLILINFFTEISSRRTSMRVRHVFFGQYFAFSLLLLISSISYFLAFVVPNEMLGFLAFIPILIGLKQIFLLLRHWHRHRHGTIESIIPTDPISTVQLEIYRMRNPSDGHIQYEVKRVEQENPDPSSSPSNANRSKFFRCFHWIFSFSTLKVISITLANSGDNISIYSSLFAQASHWQILLYIAIYFLLLFVWLILSYYLISYGPIFEFVEKYSQYLIPIVFIGIGIHILISSNCFIWLDRWIKTKDFQRG